MRKELLQEFTDVYLAEIQTILDEEIKKVFFLNLKNHEKLIKQTLKNIKTSKKYQQIESEIKQKFVKDYLINKKLI